MARRDKGGSASSHSEPAPDLPSWQDQECEQHQLLKKWRNTQRPKKRQDIDDALKAFRKGERRARKRTTTLGMHDPEFGPTSLKGSLDPRTISYGLRWIDEGKRLASQVREKVLQALEAVGLSYRHCNLVWMLMTQRSGDDRSNNPTWFNYTVLAEYLTKQKAANRTWTEDQTRQLLFNKTASAYVRAWINILAASRRELAAIGRDPKPLLESLREAKKRLRKNRSWRGWDALLNEIYQHYA